MDGTPTEEDSCQKREQEVASLHYETAERAQHPGHANIDASVENPGSVLGFLKFPSLRYLRLCAS